jgi:glycosyltransferase involved in cell wall biosynthesis
MKVVFFHRKPKLNNYSVEGAFRVIRDAMPPDIECVVAQSRFDSSGLLRRLYSIVEAAFRQGDVNHITGDVHFLSYLMVRNKTLLTILDCVVMYNTKGFRRYLLRLLWYVIPEKRVALISVISQATKDELLRFINCNPNKVRVIPVCISPKFLRCDKIFNSIKPRILQIGTADNKNLERLVAALQGISCQLEIVGKLSQNQLETLQASGIEFIASFALSDAEIVEKYIQCDIVAFVSTYEGFGMPILEANAVGRPVITANILSMPEVAGNAACLVNPYSISEIRAGVLQIVNDSEYRESLVKNGFVNVRRFDPREIANQYSDLYSEIQSAC